MLCVSNIEHFSLNPAVWSSIQISEGYIQCLLILLQKSFVVDCSADKICNQKFHVSNNQRFSYNPAVWSPIQKGTYSDYCFYKK